MYPFLKRSCLLYLLTLILSACTSTDPINKPTANAQPTKSYNALLNTQWHLEGIQNSEDSPRNLAISGVHVHRVNISILNHPDYKRPLLTVGGNEVPICGAPPILLDFDKQKSLKGTRIREWSPPSSDVCMGQEAEAGKLLGAYFQDLSHYDATGSQLKLVTQRGNIFNFRKICSQARDIKMRDITCENTL